MPSAASVAGQGQQLRSGTERHGSLYPGSRVGNVGFVDAKGKHCGESQGAAQNRLAMPDFEAECGEK